MNYQYINKGIFINRPNRFIAQVCINEGDKGEKVVTCHVKNTGRCRELLIPGVTVILEFHPDAKELGRKTDYSLIGVYKERGNGQILINMDSQIPNSAAFEWLTSFAARETTPPCFPYPIRDIKREVTYGQSRFDLAFTFEEPGGRGFMEVKGVTLEENGIAMFPDAPTERGIKHVRELIRAAENGYQAYILFVIQMKGIRIFTPNRNTHPAFGDALIEAQDAGVHILAYDCLVSESSLSIDQPVPIMLF